MKETKNEKDLSTVEITTRTHSRLPLTNGNERRESSDKQAPCERQAQTCGIIISSENKTVNDATVAKPSFSFSRGFRLRLRSEFQAVYTQGKRTRGRIMTLIVYYPPKNQEFKAGFTVRKKFYKRAVDRNKIKRRLREIVRLNRSKLSQNIWFVIHAERGILNASWQTLTDEYNELCRKAGIVN
jgi:ribonuclease P protein component